MSNIQPLKFVVGFIPRVDTLPGDLAKIGLTQRFAFVLETFRAGCVDAFFDAALYEGLVTVVFKVVAADTIRVVISRRETREVSSSEEFHRLVFALPDAEREPFSRLFFLRASSVIAVMESQPWMQVGGPDPYHDSYTLAVFTKTDLSDLVLGETRVFVKKMGGDISSVITGQGEPTPYGLIDRIKNLFGW